jgi:CDP-glucose 4,6-dehydratase
MSEAGWYAGRSVFVTGAAGIVGSWLVGDLLRQGASVAGLLRDEDSRSELFRSGNDRRIVRVTGDLNDLGLLERVLVRYEVDVIFHLGAQTQVRHAQRLPIETLDSNIRGTYHLLEAARRLSRPLSAFVVASSDKAYGETDTLPYVESHPLNGRNIYDASKSAADLVTAAYANSFGLPIGIARCANIYGGGDLNWDRIVPGTIRSLLAGSRPIIRSDGSLRRDYLHVDDAVAAYLSLGRAIGSAKEVGEAFNFGAGEPIAVRQLVDSIAEAVGRTDLEPTVLADAPNEIHAQWLDSSKARSRLDWTPRVALADGLSRTVDWYRGLWP